MKGDLDKAIAGFKYLLVNERDRKYGLYVNTVGWQTVPPNTNYPFKEHPTGYFFNPQKGRVLQEFHLVYITEGSGRFSTDSFNDKEIRKGHLIMLYPGQWHSYKPHKETGWNEYYIGFAGPLIENMLRNGFLESENQLVDIGLNEELVKLFVRAIEIAKADKNSAQQYLSGVLLHILGMVLSISRNKIFEANSMDQIIEQAKIMMNEQVFASVDVEVLAQRLNISYSLFRKVFKEYTGYSPAKYYQELKLHKAKQLLLETSQSIKEISFLLNYRSTEYFFSCFKKSVGVTPTEYRSLSKDYNNGL